MAFSEQRMRDERLRAFRLADAKKGIKKRPVDTVIVGKQNGKAYETTYYERHRNYNGEGSRYLKIASEKWASKDDARGYYGVRIRRNLPQPDGGSLSNSKNKE